MCDPDNRLVVGRDEDLFLMVGLGPITKRYLMIAASDHVQSFADFYLKNQTIAHSVEELRQKLEYSGRNLLMTEHGRVPVCKEDGDEHDQHCFHAHFLLFETELDIEKLAASYFLNHRVFENLSAALEFSATEVNYHLLSPSSNRHVVFSNPINVPRQFFRQLVAVSDKEAGGADWRQFPNWDRALELAEIERMKLE